MIILGLNAYHGDVSAVLLRDGELVAAVEEERFRRIKHCAGFPQESMRVCLEMAQISAREVDHFAVSRNPRANLIRKIFFALKKRPGLKLVRERLKNQRHVLDLTGAIANSLDLDRERVAERM